MEGAAPIQPNHTSVAFAIMISAYFLLAWFAFKVQRQNADLQMRLASAEATCATLRSQLASAQATCATLQEQLDSAEAKYNRLFISVHPSGKVEVQVGALHFKPPLPVH